jgi:hypothetical protein
VRHFHGIPASTAMQADSSGDGKGRPRWMRERPSFVLARAPKASREGDVPAGGAANAYAERRALRRSLARRRCAAFDLAFFASLGFS